MAVGFQNEYSTIPILMEIYLAGGFPVMNTKGREKELSKKMPTWKRLHSFHFVRLILFCEILTIKKEDNECIPSKRSTGE